MRAHCTRIGILSRPPSDPNVLYVPLPVAKRDTRQSSDGSCTGPKSVTTSIDELTEWIAQGDQLRVAEALRRDPSLVHARNENNDTALHLACWQKQLAIIGTIAGYGPDVDARGLFGRTALHYAVQEGRHISVPIVGFLLAMGADPSIRDDNSFTVEDWARSEMADGLPDVLAMIQRWFTQHP